MNDSSTRNPRRCCAPCPPGRGQGGDAALIGTPPQHNRTTTSASDVAGKQSAGAPTGGGTQAEPHRCPTGHVRTSSEDG